MKNNIEIFDCRRGAAAVLLGGVLLLGAGCVERDLEQRPGEGYVEIAVKWNDSASSVSAASAHETRFLIYDAAGRLVREQSGITDRFAGVLPVGSYRLIVHNTDSEHVEWRGCDSFDGAEVFAAAAGYDTGHRPAEGVPCIEEPRAVFAANVCNESSAIEVADLGNISLSVTPVAVTHHVTIHFTVTADGGDRIESLSGLIDGLSPGRYAGRGVCRTDTSCAQKFAAAASADGYEAQIDVFGFITTADSAAGTNRLCLDLRLSDGTPLAAEIDATAALQRILSANGGTFPAEIALDIDLHVRQAGLGAIVTPWDDSGTGTGSPRASGVTGGGACAG